LRRDGIEIHCDEKRGWISLACEPDAFRDFHDYVRTQLRDFPDLDLDRIDTIEVTNTERNVGERKKPRRRLIDAAIFMVLLFVGLTFGVGLAQVVRTAVRWAGAG
jgi:hypothetical protein